VDPESDRLTETGTLQPAAPVEKQIVASVSEGGRVLTADDEKFIRRLVRRLFEKEGWTVGEAGSHDEVVSMFTNGGSEDYDLVVLDLTMPGGTVEETTRTILERSATTRILLASGRHKDSRVERLTDSPRVDFIAKPYSTKELMDKVDSILAQPC
jgi:CheY-like chemotaxis protein